MLQIVMYSEKFNTVLQIVMYWGGESNQNVSNLCLDCKKKVHHVSLKGQATQD